MARPNLPSTPQHSSEDLGLALWSGEVFGAADLQVLRRDCTRAENAVYDALLETRAIQADSAFMAAGYIVANAKFLRRKRHGRLKSHILSLVRKNVIVALDPAYSHQQRYLLGCFFEGSHYGVSWIRHVRSWRLPSQQALVAPASLQDSGRGRRPMVAESLISLKNKGFIPAAPTLPSLYTSEERNSTYSGTRPRRGRKIDPSGARATTYRQRLQLAMQISALTGVPPDSAGKAGQQLDGLIRKHGFPACVEFVKAAWADREYLLTERFPMFTAQSVFFYVNYRRASHRPVSSDNVNTVPLQTLIVESFDLNGDIDYDSLRNRINLYGLHKTSATESICEEYNIDPARLFF